VEPGPAWRNGTRLHGDGDSGRLRVARLDARLPGCVAAAAAVSSELPKDAVSVQAADKSTRGLNCAHARVQGADQINVLRQSDSCCAN
jgi:hypothetical protein